MRALWQSLHTNLMQSSETLSLQDRYRSVRQSSGVLRPFPDPQTLLDHLHGDGGNPDQKNRVLATLVTVAQGSGPSHDCATVLLWLALWPGLDALYRRLLRHFSSNPEDLFSEITDRLTTGIDRLDLHRVRRIAATLIRNVERDIRRALRARWTEAALRDEMPADEVLAGDQQAHVSSSGFLPFVDVDAEAAFIGALLEKWIGNDAQLVVAVAITGETQNEAALRLGISHDAARKRYQRAIRRLRLRIEEIR